MTNLRSPRHTKSLQHYTRPEYRAVFTCSLLFVMIVATLSFGFMRAHIALAGPSLQENGGDPGTPVSDPGAPVSDPGTPVSDPGPQPSNSVENFSGSDNILLPDNPIAVDEVAPETVGDTTLSNGDAPQTINPNADAIIRITNEGFDISQKTIKRGEQVIWLNTGTKSVTIQQNPLFRSFLPVVLSQSAVGELDAAGNSIIPVAEQAMQLAENIDQPVSSLGSDALGFTLQPGEQHTQQFDNPGGFLFMLDSNKTPCVINVEEGTQPLPTATATNTEVPPTAPTEAVTPNSTPATPTATNTPPTIALTNTATRTPTRTPPNTPTVTATGTPSDTPTNTPTATNTGTNTPTRTPTLTPTATDTTAPTPTPTVLASPTQEPQATATSPSFSTQQVTVTLPTLIGSDMLLTANHIYLVRDVITLTTGTRMTVEQGAVIKFYPLAKLVVNGVLTVTGTPNFPAVFTSIYDDRYGGDTLSDGAATWPEAGDWNTIEFRGPSSRGNIQYALIAYGGRNSLRDHLNARSTINGSITNNGSNISLIGSEIIHSETNGMLWLNNARGQIINNVINYCLGNGIDLRTSSHPLIQNNTIVHNRNNAIQHEGNSFPTIMDNTVYGNYINGIGITGTIGTGNWHNNPNLPYVTLGNVAIEPNNVLTMPIGTVMKFMPKTTLIIRGALVARSSEEQPIVFTSLKDDDYGGDTQQDGAATKPNPGDWGSVYFADNSNDSKGWLEHVLIRYGGSGYVYGVGTAFSNLALDSASPRVENSIFERSKVYGVEFLNVSSPLFQENIVNDNNDHGVWVSPSSAAQVLNNQFLRNGGFAIYVKGSSPTFFDGNLAKGNRINGIGIHDILNANTYWEYDLPYVFDGLVTIDLNTTLEIQPGAVLKFMPGAKVVVLGNLKALGSGEQPILFTSVKDDSYAGDTNGDNALSAPAPGDWESISFEASAGGSTLSYVTMRYGGSNQATGSVSVKTAAPSIQHLTIMGSKYRGLHAQATALILTDATFAHNAIGVYNDTQAGVSIQHSSFYSNTQYGLRNENNQVVIDATGNWWGHETGPSHTNNINGAGDHIIGGVEVVEWLLEPAVPLPDPLPTFPSAPTYTQVSGIINTNTTWEVARSPYLVIDNVTVNPGVSLNIEPGVVLKFATGKNLHINGILIANGTPAQRIIFTSFKDDTVGGDTNNDKTATWPKLADWGRVYFGDTSDDLQTKLRYTEIRYAGAVTQTSIISTGLYIESASPLIEENRFVQNAGYGIYMRNQSTPNIRNNWILDNSQGGIRCDSTSGGVVENNQLWGNSGYAVYMDASCYPTFNGNVSYYNENNGVRVGGVIKFNRSWTPNLTYVLDGIVTIDNGPTLTLQPGTVVKFKDLESHLHISGSVVAVGNQEQPIVFTSLHDDSYGGDTNNDDGSYWPMREDWGQIHFADSSNDITNLLQETIVQYGGALYKPTRFLDYGFHNIFLDSSAPRLISNIIQHSFMIGLGMRNQANPLVENNVIARNHGAGISISQNSTPIIRENHIWGNWGFAGEMTADCKPELSNNTAHDNLYDAIKSSGTIASDTTWDLDLPYSPANITIASGAKLTLPPGSIIKFLPGAVWNVYGTLDANGTTEERIVFTSIKDDAFGGDTNMDGDNSTPAENDWNSLIFYDQADASTLNFVEVYYGGDAAIKVVNGTVDVSNSLFQQNRTALFYQGSAGEILDTQFILNTLFGLKEVDSALTIAGSVFENNRRGIYVETATFGHLPLNNNIFINNWEYGVWTDGLGFNLFDASNLFVNEVGNSFWLDNGVIEEDTTLYSGRVYRFDAVTFGTTDIPVVVNIDPGVVMKFAKTTSSMTVMGAIYANGDESDPVVFTSYQDDAWEGDTNNDADATQPAPGDWVGLVLLENTEAQLNFAKVLYAGSSSTSGAIKGSKDVTVGIFDSEISYSNSSGIYINNTVTGYAPTLTVERSLISYNGKNGIYMKGVSGDFNTLSVQSSVINDNQDVGILVSRAEGAMINSNDIFNNHLSLATGTKYGIKNDSFGAATIIDATNNYWGSEDGPAPFGSGDGINGTLVAACSCPDTDRVTADPFSDVPNDPIIPAALREEGNGTADNQGVDATLTQKVYLPVITK